MDAPKKKPPYKSMKNWLVLLYGLVVIVNRKFELGLTTTDLLFIAGGAASLLGVEGLGDIVSRWHSSAAMRENPGVGVTPEPPTE